MNLGSKDLTSLLNENRLHPTDFPLSFSLTLFDRLLKSITSNIEGFYPILLI